MTAVKEDPKVRIGVNILETLTTGMYRNPMVMYREYIQNSSDAIDKAVESGLLGAEEGQINIWLENDKVSIEDNGIGIKAADFVSALYSIGESTKNIDKDKGFRGIGHWCGFASCDKLRFIAKYTGEPDESVMECDAVKMRQMMAEHRTGKHAHTIDDVLGRTIAFATRKAEDVEAHYFKVELEGIKEKDLLNFQNIKDYLSFVAPVGYATEFPFRDDIIKFSHSIGYNIPQYVIRINGEQILKKYQYSFDTYGKGSDKITSIECVTLEDDEGEPLAWMWFGISSFKAQISAANKMRGIRLRCKNIQLGAENALQHLFSEGSGRGLYYFIGEVFAISGKLIPDSQRDYFEAGEARDKFDLMLTKLFSEHLTRIYQYGSQINSSYNKYEKVVSQLNEIRSSAANQGNNHAIDDLQKELDNNKNNLEKVKGKISSSSILNKLKDQINENVKSQHENGDASRAMDNARKKRLDPAQKNPVSVVKEKDAAKTANSRLVPLDRIIDVLKNVLPQDMAETAIAAIVKMSAADVS